MDERGFVSKLSGVEDMVNYILKSRGAKKVGKLWAHHFVKQCLELKMCFNRVYNFQRALYKDPKLIEEWFGLVSNMQAKYGIVDSDFYNFDETSFMMEYESWFSKKRLAYENTLLNAENRVLTGQEAEDILSQQEVDNQIQHDERQNGGNPNGESSTSRCCINAHYGESKSNSLISFSRSKKVVYRKVLKDKQVIKDVNYSFRVIYVGVDCLETNC
ncbi:hypothetical protein SS1G_05024 [Sclerotinia sclerotiorum 1980 UF-70]|uniref:HTH CENPB-type domain-containing protein n=1 Tax=Sclerotinia sclerotiorum (strain ATCC 18683 / 1980 / Ss-1) TaxID=665079 RepID=A7EI82_SCLS1|nr:hypothetical protein SS1G_05024 [Sclerotinia sclerotiorum 1980 UF-70]EDO02548.1 hypothetical protein SS1G_05024 [Sclerotinia sclerotiorum 1980 UF-70]